MEWSSRSAFSPQQFPIDESEDTTQCLDSQMNDRPHVVKTLPFAVVTMEAGIRIEWIVQVCLL
jgi:hypothetical protein